MIEVSHSLVGVSGGPRGQPKRLEAPSQGRAAGAMAAMLMATLLVLPGDAWGQGRGSQIGEEQSRRQVRLAIESLKKGALDAAEKHLTKAVAYDPKNTDALKKYAALLLKKRRFQQSEELLLRGLEHNPRDPYLEAYLAVTYCWAGQSDRALKTFKNVEPFIAQAGAMHLLVGQCLLYNGDYAFAAEALGKALSSIKNPRRALDLRLRLSYAAALLELGELSKAQKHIAYLSERLPDNKQVLALKAGWLLRKRRCREARDLYERLSGDAKSHLVGLAEAQVCLRKPQAALVAVSRYLEARRSYTEAYLRKRDKFANKRALRQIVRASTIRGDVSVTLAKYDQAEVAYGLAAKVGGQTPEIEAKLAGVYFAKGRYDACWALLAPALKRADPGRPVLRLAIRSALRSGNKRNALKVANRLLTYRALSAGDFYLAGVVRKAAGRFEQAIDPLERAHRMKRESTTIQRDLGMTYLLQARRDATKDRTDLAIRRLKLASSIGVFRSSAAIDTNLALAYLQRGQPKLALDHATKALNRKKGSRTARLVMARSLARLGRRSKAQKHYRALVRGRLAVAPAQRPALWAEAAVVAVQNGDLRAAVECLQGADHGEGAAQRPARASRNVTRAHYAVGIRLLQRKQVKRAWGHLMRASEGAQALPQGERDLLHAAVFVLSLQSRHTVTANALVAQHGERLLLALSEPYRDIGRKLLPMLVEVSDSQPAERIQGARRLASLARSLPGGAQRSTVNDIASQAYHLVAHQLLGQGQGAKASRLLDRSVALSSRAPLALRHNRAIARYRSGRVRQSARDLQTIADKLAAALCNLAAHEHNRGKPREAYQLFKACQSKGGKYPGLGGILALKEQIFGS